MARYALRRLLQAIGVIWMTFTLTFFLLYWIPGDSVQLMLSDNSGSTYVDPAAVEKLRTTLGLDAPWYEQYLAALTSLLSGDLGNSIAQGQPVSALLATAIPSTIEVSVLGLVLAILIGGGIALAASYARHSNLSRVLLAFPAFAVALPSFWVGIVLIQIFSFRLHLFPAFGNEGLASAILPAVTLGIYYSAMVTQVLDASFREVEGQAFIQTALARGASRSRILFRHVVRNAAPASLTIIGMITGGLLAGAMITETVFTRSGIGQLLVEAVKNRDFPVLLVTVSFVALAYTTINLIVDLILPLVDPRLFFTITQR